VGGELQGLPLAVPSKSTERRFLAGLKS
jgi:hypothetical protein